MSKLLVNQMECGMMIDELMETKTAVGAACFQKFDQLFMSRIPSGMMEGFELLTAIRFNPTETRIPDSGFPVKLRS